MSLAAEILQNTGYSKHHSSLDTSDMPRSLMSHEELVVSNLMEVLEEHYSSLTKKEHDALVMLLLEHQLNDNS